MSNNTKMWMVRAGEASRLFEIFEKKKIVAIGFNKIKDLSKIDKPEKIKDLVAEKYPEYKKGQAAIQAGQLIRFSLVFNKGDYVITYSQGMRIYLVGKITSDYLYDTKISEYHHVRKVKWLGQIPRDKLSTSTKNTLGAISTLFDVGENGTEEMLKVLKGEELVEDIESQEAEMDTIKDDTKSRAFEFIKDKILALDWEEMQELVAGILRAMGYRTLVSPKGADRGKDIQASPDGLGLEDPRIVVEVKHRTNSAMGSKEIRSFTGGLRQGSKGLYVSTGGFSKDAKYEAERSTIPLTLVDLDLLAELTIQYYDNFDQESRKLIPLVKMYWPA